MPNVNALLDSGKRSGLLIILGSVLVAGLAAPGFLAMYRPDALHPGPGVSQRTYCPPISLPSHTLPVTPPFMSWTALLPADAS